MANNKMNPLDWLRKQLDDGSRDVLRSMVKDFAEMLMSAEADGLCGAEYGERSGDRVNQRNGYRPRLWDTRAGTIELAVPKLRRGSYFPDWLLEPRRRAEKALYTVVAQAFLSGVSTRKVERVAEAMGITSLSKSRASEMAKELDEQVRQFRTRPLSGGFPYVWLDALSIKVREGGRVVNIAVVIAIGVRNDGHREVLGLEAITTEDGAGWLAFLRDLVARGLDGVQLVISDCHVGLRDAAIAVFAGAAWQRCRTHFMRNLLTKTPKSAHQWVATAVRSIFGQHDAESVTRQLRTVSDSLRPSFPAVANALDEAEPDITAFKAFPKAHWRKIWSNNPLERLNKEIRRRTDVVGIFPDRTSCIRLIGALLAEQNDEWAIARRYMSEGSMELLLPDSLEPPTDQPILGADGAITHAA